MNVDSGAIANPHTTVFKSQQPQVQRLEMREITDLDFQNFSFTGIQFNIPVPLAQISSEALIGINIDGFIPTPNIHPNVFRNLFPVKRSYISRDLDGLDIRWTWSSLVAMSNYLSMRMISGQVGVCFRIASNTAQSGNLLVTQGSGLMRKYYGRVDKYEGLRFNNSSVSAIDYAPNGFCLIDLSLNRNVSITPIRRENTYKTDFAQKIAYLEQMIDSEVGDLPFASQFLEDWLFISMQGDLPHPDSSQITFNMYYDWSRVEFAMPMLPMIASSPTYKKQILLFNKTFQNKTGVQVEDPDKWDWLPGKAPELFINCCSTGNHKQHYKTNAPMRTVDETQITYKFSQLFANKQKFIPTTTQAPPPEVEIFTVKPKLSPDSNQVRP